MSVMIRYFVKIYKIRGLTANADKSRVMVLKRDERCVCEVSVDGRKLEHVTEFKYLEFVFDKLGEDEVEY